MPYKMEPEEITGLLQCDTYLHTKLTSMASHTGICIGITAYKKGIVICIASQPSLLTQTGQKLAHLLNDLSLQSRIIYLEGGPASTLPDAA
jgi:hypothetical protein